MEDNQEAVKGPVNAKIKPLPARAIAFEARSLSKNTIQKYGVTVGDPENPEIEAIYPFFNEDGRHISNKIRYTGKRFEIEGDWKNSGLFGEQLFPAGSAKQITVTEGNDDAMAAYEMQGSRFPCVSVASASSAVKDAKKRWEYLNSFETIVLVFDNDQPGKEAAEKVAAMFELGKVRIFTPTLAKDANDYLKMGKSKEFIKEWWDAPKYMPSGLRIGTDMWDEVKEQRKYETVSYPWAGLQHATYGIRLSEFTLVTAFTKIGKTTVLKEVASHLRDNAKPEYGVGFLFLEESNADTALGLMSIVANKPLHLPDVRENVTQEELRQYFDKAVNSDRIVMWDHFGSNAIEEVLSKVRHMHALGCKYIILDHLSIIVSDQSGDERKQLDEISTKLKMLCMELNIAVIAVIHRSRSGVIRGSAGPEQIANITIQLTRDMEDPDEWRRNVTKVSVIANRFCGRTGPACYLWYDPMTGRLIELDKAGVDRYEQGIPAANAKEQW